QQDTYPTDPAHGEVLVAVAVEVPHHHRAGIGADGVVDRSLERAVATVQEYADVVAVIVGHGQVVQAVLIEVPCRHRAGIVAGSVAPGRDEGAVTVPQQHAHAVAQSIRVGHGEIEVAVAVEVPRRQRRGNGAHGERAASPEGPVPPSQQDGNRV